ncbi:WDR76 protein, partial [Centropus unirufus]|nr:WDR76 protein [Centropus unirufus]
EGNLELSAYERKRLKNLTENAKFFAALKLHEVCGDSGQFLKIRIGKGRESSCSSALLGFVSEGFSGYLVWGRNEPPLCSCSCFGSQKCPMSFQPRVPAGPLPMVREDEESSKLAEDLLATWRRISEVLVRSHSPAFFPCATNVSVLLSRYKQSLNCMVLSEENIKKVVKSRVSSMAMHPSESILFVAAGDKIGQIGLWNVDCKSEEGAQVFVPHNSLVSCMHFSPFNPAHLLSLSEDTLRCGDVTRAVFDDVCRGEESFSSFSFLDSAASTAVVGHWGGSASVVDRRTPGTSPELSADIGFKRLRTVHVHPAHKQYFLAAGAVDVSIYDVRCLKPSGNKPVSTLRGHTKSVASAYFSPVTGNRVVTVCADDRLRGECSPLFSLPLFACCRHNNNTGRWLTRFQAVWDPKREDCFVVGSMARPRQIEIFQDTGKLLHSFVNLDLLGSVCSINVVHPTKNILVGGNSSGRLHVF